MKLEELLGLLVLEYTNNKKDLWYYADELFEANKKVSDRFYLIEEDDNKTFVSKIADDDNYRDCLSITCRGARSFIIKSNKVPSFNNLDKETQDRVAEYFSNDIFGLTKEEMLKDENKSVKNIELYAELCSWCSVIGNSVQITRKEFNKF